MPRPQRKRRVCSEPKYVCFYPEGIAERGVVRLGVDEFETLRLVDFVGLTHEQCARRMQVSRTTVTEIYERARRKLAEALVCGRRLEIAGGSYCLCEGTAGCEGCKRVPGCCKENP